MFEERRTAQRMLFEALTSKPSKVLGLAGDNSLGYLGDNL